MRSSTVIRPGPTANLLSECGSGSLFLCSCIVIPHCHLGHKNKGKKKEDMELKAVKALDLLEHAVELGHMDALFKLAQVSMVSKW